MRRPSERGEEISLMRIERWLDHFGSYRHQVSESKLERWLRQFERGDQDLAARLLDSIDFIGHTQMSRMYRDLLGAIPGWHRDPRRRSGRWRFVAYTSSAGESGDSMLHTFRLANNLDARAYDELFVHPRDLLQERLGPDDTVVLIDDFSGTGNQACRLWLRSFQELLPGEPRAFLVLLGACTIARRRIVEQTRLRPVIGIQFTERDNILSDACIHFTRDEKQAILKYCGVADQENPRGWGDSGLVVVFAHRCPNNSIPILHVTRRNWSGLFPRHD
jgi:hypothetical protein